jgi:hypothetical protein
MLRLSYNVSKPSSLSGRCTLLDRQNLNRKYVGRFGLIGTQVLHAMD